MKAHFDNLQITSDLYVSKLSSQGARIEAY